MNRLAIIFTAILFLSLTTDNFKSEQLRYPRVRTAYSEKEGDMNRLLQDNSIQKQNLRIYMRIFKHEKELELWAKNEKDSSFKFLKTYSICRTSGTLGPKRQEGDLQIPEGFYHINTFNPASSFYLSMKVNYPNTSDRILGVKSRLGGDIFIHGDCVTIGCVPITDEQIKELYIICIEAKDRGQNKIPVTIYPAKLSDNNFHSITNDYSGEIDKVNLWSDLKVSYDKFEVSKQLPTIVFLENGRHKIK